MIDKSIIQLLESDSYESYIKKLISNNHVISTLILENNNFNLRITKNFIILSDIEFGVNKRCVIYNEILVIKSFGGEYDNYKENYNYVLEKLEDKFKLPIEIITDDYFRYEESQFL